MMQNGAHSHVTVEITVGQQHIDDADHFSYLGSIVSNTSNVEADVKYRMAKVAGVFQEMS